MEVILNTLRASVLSPYNVAYAISITLLLTRLDARVRLLTVLPKRLGAALVATWALGTISDLVFPNSITWTVLPACACALIFRDFRPPARIARLCLLMCAWMYSLTAAEVVNAWAHGGTLLAAEVSLLYMLVVLVALQLLERKGSLERPDVSLVSVVPVVVVCASGLVARAILYLRSDFGMGPYSVGTLESILTCLNGQVAELVVYYAVLHLVCGFEDRRRLQAEQHLMEGRLAALDAYRESGENLRILRHEVKNQYAYIRLLLENHDYERAEEFFGEMSMRANPTFLHVNSGNRLVDDIVNLELSRATGAGVDVDSRMAVPPELPFEEIDLASLLMNLLDNAIEACAGVPAGKRCIHLGILADQGSFIVSVSNPASSAPLQLAGGRLRTTKPNADLHGFGTGIVKKVAEKYDGVADFTFEDGTFTAKVMLALA